MTRSILPFVLAALASLPFAAACSSTTEGRGLGSDAGTSAGVDSGTSQGGNHYVTDCTNYGGAISGCECTYGSGTSTTECDTAVLPTALCCADVGWPDTNLKCQCTLYTCKLQNGTGSDSCVCGSYESGNLTTCSDAVCCSSTDTDECHCGPEITCNSFETQVSQCSAKVANCGGTTLVSVAACSR